MSKELNKIQVEKFIETWRITPEARLAPELASVHNESKAIPDSSTFEITDQGLLDPKTGLPIKNFIRRDTPLYRREYKILEKLEEWTKKLEETKQEDNITIWLSPPYPGKYPCAKITLNGILYDPKDEKKYLISTYIRFGDRTTNTLDIVPDSNITDTETQRETLFVMSQDEANKILEHIKSKYPIHTQEDENLLNTQIQGYIKDIKNGVPTAQIIQRMDQNNFFGEFDLTCHPQVGFSDYLTLNMPKSEAKFVRNCGNCGAIINSFISAGYICKKCGGVYKGC